MNKVYISIFMAVVVLFTAAVGLCVKTLDGARAVAAFEDGLRIVVDAGHGGIDGGVVGKMTGVKESGLNLSISYKLKTELEEMGFLVTLTRKTEAGLYGTTAKGFKKRDMQKRKEIIDECAPAMVISIHQNFYPSKNTRGAQVFYSKKNAGSQKLALGFQGRLNALYAEEGVRGRNAASGEFFMLECASCPSVIVECGFLSNAKDEALLAEEGWQKRLCQSLAAGVLAYFADSSA